MLNGPLSGTLLTMFAQQIESHQKITEEIRKSRHDLRHHNCILTAYAEKGDLQGLLLYLKQQNEIADLAYEHYFCENETINTILQVYEKKAESKGIRVTVLAEADREIRISAPDLCGNHCQSS